MRQVEKNKETRVGDDNDDDDCDDGKKKKKKNQDYSLCRSLSLASTMIPAIRSTHSWVCVQSRVLSMTSRIAGK